MGRRDGVREEIKEAKICYGLSLGWLLDPALIPRIVLVLLILVLAGNFGTEAQGKSESAADPYRSSKNAKSFCWQRKGRN